MKFKYLTKKEMAKKVAEETVARLKAQGLTIEDMGTDAAPAPIRRTALHRMRNGYASTHTINAMLKWLDKEKQAQLLYRVSKSWDDNE